MFEVAMYTDGSCSRNGQENNAGGWSAILQFQGREKVLCGNAFPTTNNCMELTAVIEGLKALKKPCRVTVYSDSSYVISGAANIRDWRRRGWRTASGSVPKNKELWDELIKVGLAGGHKISFVHVKGHADHALNNRCDKLAREQSKIAKARGSIVV